MDFRSFLYGIATVVILLAVVGGACLSVSGMKSSDVLDAVTSPTGEWTATRYTVMGGGAPGWCSQRVDVHRSDRPFDLEAAIDDFEPVSTAGCSVDLALEWTGDSRLEISYPLHPDGVTVFQRPRSPDRGVRVDYRIVGPGSSQSP